MAKNTDEVLKKAILEKLLRKGRLGSNYMPIEESLSKIQPNSRKRTKNLIREMRKDKLINYKKGRKVISIRHDSRERIKEMLEGEIPNILIQKYLE